MVVRYKFRLSVWSLPWQHTLVIYSVAIVSKHLTKQLSKRQEARDGSRWQWRKEGPFVLICPYPGPSLVPLRASQRGRLGGDEEGLKAGAQQTSEMNLWPEVKLVWREEQRLWVWILMGSTCSYLCHPGKVVNSFPRASFLTCMSCRFVVTRNNPERKALCKVPSIKRVLLNGHRCLYVGHKMSFE